MAEYTIQGLVQTQPVFDSNNLIDINADSILRAILINEQPSVSTRYSPSSISNYIKTTSLSNFGSSAENYFNYGYAHHPDGIPDNKTTIPTFRETFEFVPLAVNSDEIRKVIELEIGQEIKILTLTVGLPFSGNLISDDLQNDPDIVLHNRGTSNIFDLFRLLNFSIISEANDNRYRFQELVSFISSTIIYKYQKLILSSGGDSDNPIYVLDPLASPVEKTIDLLLTNGFTANTFLHQVTYELVSTKEAFVWLYDQATNVYPGIAADPTVRPGSYPYAMLIQASKRTDKGDLGLDYKKHTDNMIRTLGTDLDTFMESIIDPDDPENLDDVVDAFLLFGIQIDTNSIDSLSYLYEFFRVLHFDSPIQTQQDWINSNFIPIRVNSRSFDGFRVKFDIRYNFTTMRVLNGLITDPQPLPDLTLPIPIGAEIDPNHDGSIDIINGVSVGSITSQIVLGNQDSYDANGVGSNNHYIVFRKQLTDSTFSELVVEGLEHYTLVIGQKNNGQNISTAVIATLATISNGGLYLPIAHDIIAKFRPLIKHNIMTNSFMFVTHVAIVTKLPWYATSTFKELLKFAFIVITITSLGSSSSFTELIEAIVKQYIINILIQEGLPILVDQLGGNSGLIIATILAIASLSIGEVDETNFINAERLMFAATQFITASNSVAQDAFLDLQSDIEEFQELTITRKEEIQRLSDLLGPQDQISNLYELVLNKTLVDFNESPEEFFNRSIHITNPGVVSLDLIDLYVDDLLDLPRFNILENKQE